MILLILKNKIFDAGHSEQVMDQFGKDVSKVTNISEIDDQLQTVIYKADQISCRESLQTPEKLTKVSEELGIISTDILNKCIGVETFNIAPVYKLMLESILQIGVVLNKVIQEKILSTDDSKELESLKFADRSLSAFVLRPIGKRLDATYSSLDLYKGTPKLYI